MTWNSIEQIKKNVLIILIEVDHMREVYTRRKSASVFFKEIQLSIALMAYVAGEAQISVRFKPQKLT
jgi:hypothetical protein